MIDRSFTIPSPGVVWPHFLRWKSSKFVTTVKRASLETFPIWLKVDPLSTCGRWWIKLKQGESKSCVEAKANSHLCLCRLDDDLYVSELCGLLRGSFKAIHVDEPEGFMDTLQRYSNFRALWSMRWVYSWYFSGISDHGFLVDGRD